MKYRVVEKSYGENVLYQVQEKEPESKEWMELLDDEDNVLEFTNLESAKEFVGYLREINETLQKTEKVVYEV